MLSGTRYLRGNRRRAGDDDDRGSHVGSQAGGPETPPPQHRRPSSSSPPPWSLAFLEALSDENSMLARFLLRGGGGGDGRDSDGGGSWLTRSCQGGNGAKGGDVPRVGMEGSIYPLALEPLEKRNERVIMAFEAYAVFGALFMGGIWIIYEWGSPKGDFGDSDINPVVARTFELIMALAITANAILALYGATWWIFSILVNSSQEDYTIQATKPLTFLQYLLVVTIQLVFLGLILGTYCNLSPNLIEAVVAITIVAVIYSLGFGIRLQFMWATIPLEIYHMPPSFKWQFLPYWRKQGREDLRARAKLRAEDLTRRACHERKRLDPSFNIRGGDAGPVQTLLTKAATNLDMADYDVSTFVTRLHKDWYTSVDDLKHRNVDFLAHYMPRKLAEEVHRLAEFENSDNSYEGTAKGGKNH